MFEIDKKIAVVASMDGDSIDAIAVLQILQKRYKQLPVLARAAAYVGADVPFLMESRPTIASNRNPS